MNAPSASQNPRRPRVLIVDDEQSVRILLKSLLEGAGYACVVAADAEQARQVVSKEPFDLVLTDMMLPGDSGLAFARHVLQEHPATAIVMITGLDDPRLANTALEVGAGGFVIKPFSTSDLLFQIAGALRRRSLEQENAALREQLSAQKRPG
ncbi:MAG: response regulator [Planctomycetes bacterium]|nr:response regulator [Planctomycetota bacterium]